MNTSSPKNPIVLVHGLWDTDAIFQQLRPYLVQRGWQVHSLDLIPSDGSAPLEVLAQQLAEFIDRTFLPQQSIDLLGFSMGGIISRYYVQRLNGLARVRRLITIASPHRGTIVAYLSNKPGAKQMRPFSKFLTSLNNDVDQLRSLQVTSTWTPFDTMIVPGWSSVIPNAVTPWIPVLWHKWMIRDRRSFQLVIRALEQPLEINAGHEFLPMVSIQSP